MKKLILPLLGLALLGCEKDSADMANPGSTGQGGSLARFAISENHLYAVNGTKLKVFDISNTSEPVFKGQDDLWVNVETLFARDEQTLFVGTTQGMYIYDISSPPEVTELGHYEHVVSCDPVVANKTHAFVTLRSSMGSVACNRSINQLDVIDITNLRQPYLVNSMDMAHPIGLGLHGDTLLVCDDGVKVFDISEVMNLKTLSHQSDIDAVDIIPYKDLMIIATTSGFEQYEFKNGKLNLLSKI